MNKRIFISGMGSIGKRHARNAIHLGHDVQFFEPSYSGSIPWELPIQRVGAFEAGLQAKPDAVIIASPPDKHADQALQALQCGLPTLIEKPMAVSILQAEEICRVTQSTRLTCGVGYQLRAIPSLRAVIGSIGILGPYAVHVEFAYSDRKWRRDPATYKAGIILEASHELDLLSWIFHGGICSGEKVKMIAGIHVPEHEEPALENLAMVLVQFPTGELASAHLDAMAPKYRRRVIIYEERHTTEWNYTPEEGDQSYVLELQAFLQGKPYCTSEDGLIVVRMMDACHRSAQSGAWEIM